MKAGLTTSVALHAVALGLGIFTLAAPEPMELGAVESFPVDIVPMEEFSQSVTGDREAPAAERPAPVPTTRPDIVENAQNVGDNSTDLSTPPTPDPRPRPVETAEAPPPSPTPDPTPAPEPEPEPAPEPEPVPTTEVAPQPQPQQEVTPEPEPATQVAEAPEPQPDSPVLPDTAPIPQARPQQPTPQAQAARTPERREPERERQEPPRETAARQNTEEESVEDQVAALLNRDRASGGGAQRSTEQAALGGRQTTGAELSQSERDAIIAQLRSCWNVPVGAEGSSELKARVRFRLDPSGTLQGVPEIEQASGNRQFDESTTRAVRICSQRGFQLPSDKYETWSEVVVNFSPRDMF